MSDDGSGSSGLSGWAWYSLGESTGAAHAARRYAQQAQADADLIAQYRRRLDETIDEATAIINAANADIARANADARQWAKERAWYEAQIKNLTAERDLCFEKMKEWLAEADERYWKANDEIYTARDVAKCLSMFAKTLIAATEKGKSNKPEYIELKNRVIDLFNEWYRNGGPNPFETEPLGRHLFALRHTLDYE